ncbi:MAG: phosphopentomutase, partial [Anaerovoracaceae bacterium]
NTFGHIDEAMPTFCIPNLTKLGFCHIDGVAKVLPAGRAPIGSYGRLSEQSKGKDTITGHFELMGIETKTPFKTYPDGFPQSFIADFEAAIGRKVLGNYSASGTVIIEDLGPEHEATGAPIVYTSADSVFQIAANTQVLPLEELYRICEIARKMLVGDLACGRVIARPYLLEDGKRIRTSQRKDYAVSPPAPTVLDQITKVGQTVYAVGKIQDIFNNQGISEAVHTTDNMDGVDQTLSAMKQNFSGLIFTNLVDFDSQYGHRRDPKGYGQAIEAFDARLPELMAAMGPEDILMLCADHGNDPTFSGYDHTREYIPLVVYGKPVEENINLGTRTTFADIGATIADYLGAQLPALGKSFLAELNKK